MEIFSSQVNFFDFVLDVLYADDTMWKYRDKSVFKREWGDYVDNWIDHNSVSRVAKQWGEIPQLHQAYHYFDEEWLEDDKIITWPSLTKVFSASSALVGATLWHPFDHQRGYHPDPFWGGIMDAYRQPKFSYYLFKSLSSVDESNNITNVEHEPFVYIAHLMTPFSPNNVTIFTNCEEVKLTSFGKHYGIQKAYDDLSPVPRVPVVFTNAFNYDELANVDIPDGDEGACIPYATGCTNPNACNSTTGVINDISLCDFPPVNYYCDYLNGDEGEYVISCVNDIDCLLYTSPSPRDS